MTSIRIALNELRRITAGKLPRLAVAALVMIPMLYAGLYLYANHDPYANLDRVPAALVVEDTGATLSTGEKVAFGSRIAADLIRVRSFDWTETTAAKAATGVADGTFTFALELPATFSSDLASTAEFEPRQAGMRLITNDANNYLGHTIANQVVAEVTKSISTTVSQTAANRLLTGYTDIHASVSKAAAGASDLAAGVTSLDSGAATLSTAATDLVAGQKKLLAGTKSLDSGASDIAKGATTLKSGAVDLETGLGTVKTDTATLPKQTRALATGARKVADGDAQVVAAGKAVADQSQTLVDSFDDLDTALTKQLEDAGLTPAPIKQVLTETAKLRKPVEDANTKIQTANGKLGALSKGATDVADGNEKLAAAAPTLVAGIVSANTAAGKVASGAGDLATGATKLASGASDLEAGQQTAYDGATKLAKGATTLHGGTTKAKAGALDLEAGLAKGLKQIPNPSEAERTAMAATLGSPVAVTDDSLSAAGDYGVVSHRSSSACRRGSAATSCSCSSVRCRRARSRPVSRRYGSRGRLDSACPARHRPGDHRVPRRLAVARDPDRAAGRRDRIPHVGVDDFHRDRAHAGGVVRLDRQVPRSGLDGGAVGERGRHLSLPDLARAVADTASRATDELRSRRDASDALRRSERNAGPRRPGPARVRDRSAVAQLVGGVPPARLVGKEARAGVVDLNCGCSARPLMALLLHGGRHGVRGVHRGLGGPGGCGRDGICRHVRCARRRRAFGPLGNLVGFLDELAADRLVEHLCSA